MAIIVLMPLRAFFDSDLKRVTVITAAGRVLMPLRAFFDSDERRARPGGVVMQES